jgi:uncharacterized protein (DUF1501 family)
MHPTRRDMLRLGLGSAALLASGNNVPVFLARTAAIEPDRNNKGKVLVVVELSGGNDGLNSVIPYNDPAYRQHRPKLNLVGKRLHKIDDHIAFHPELGGLAKLLTKGQLAVVQSVGYPNPNRSHFESMAIWQTAKLPPADGTPGWLARSLDRQLSTPGGDSPALQVSTGSLCTALAGSQKHVPAFDNLEQVRRRLGMSAGADADRQRADLDRLGAQRRGAPGSLLQFVERCTLMTYASSARLEGILQGKSAPRGYPEVYPLAQHLLLIAQLIKAGLNTSIYYTQLDGFDTHANQLGTHSHLMQVLDSSLSAFLNDLNRSGEAKRVLVLVFSEFGRRLRENASGGTDHGTAAPVLLLGCGVRPGVHGPYPNLQDLDAGGDPKHALDFRQVYATILDHWLGCPSQQVLGEKFLLLPVLG